MNYARVMPHWMFWLLLGVLASHFSGDHTQRALAASRPPKPVPTCEAQLDRFTALAAECADLLNYCGAAAVDLAKRLEACEAEP